MTRYRIPAALIVLVIWTALTLLLPPNRPEGGGSLEALVTSGLGWNFLAAAGFAVAAVWLLGWRDTGLTARPRPGSWWLGLPPLLYIAAATAAAVWLGLPAPAAIGWIVVNTLLVGLSEELMFRGILLAAFRAALPFWPAALIVSAMFGAIHSLNVLVTGHLEQALLQSGAAFLSGLLFLALRLQTGSLWPPILLHGLWDCATFLLSMASAPSAPALALLPFGLVALNWIYTIWLLRRPLPG